MNKIVLSAIVLSISLAGLAQTIPAAARRDIDAGNQAWIEALKTGNAALVAATYEEDGVECAPSGECEKGRAAYEQKTKARLEKLGRAQSAEVHTAGSVRQGDFIYEWGSARAEFPGGKKIDGRYLTVWHRQADGHWKIFRNLPIPADRAP